MDNRPVGTTNSRVSRRDDYLAKQAKNNYQRAYRKEAGAKSVKDIAKGAARKWRVMANRARVETDYKIKCAPCGKKKRRRSCKRRRSRKRRRSCRRKRRRSSCGRKRRRRSRRKKSPCKRRKRSKSPCMCPPC